MNDPFHELNIKLSYLWISSQCVIKMSSRTAEKAQQLVMGVEQKKTLILVSDWVRVTLGKSHIQWVL